MLDSISDFAFTFTYAYPLFMSFLWMTGALVYFLRWEYPWGVRNRGDARPRLRARPMVSILVPCHNEESVIAETIGQLNRQSYPNFEIVAINDGSSDRTGETLDALAAQFERLRVIHLDTNRGKAAALRMGTVASRAEYLVCIDADAMLDEHALHWFVWHFLSSPRVGAVTGNPRIRTRSTLLGKLQVGEFSSIIGMIKRAQRIYGRVFTVSGVVVAFRKSAIQKVGYWGTDTVTDDIDISWKLQLGLWDVRFETNALCWILMPETLSGLWRQRLRWAQGGAEVFIKNFTSIWSWERRRFFLVFAEYVASVTWSYCMLSVMLLFALGLVMPLPESLRVETLFPGWNGMILALTCMIQFMVSLAIDSRYDHGLGKYYYWMIWYPVAFWLVNVFTVAVAIPKAVSRLHGRQSTWNSPDRGLR
ncbi:MAG: poly-beta-1,6 N-acetyl-D-glucosamine synthase [Proteobacteria bacterium]|nr:MAG: poly-beta-1,6 N-acetyl-D-glucosamine synthase [Pseudomonadota bacterium]